MYQLFVDKILTNNSILHQVLVIEYNLLLVIYLSNKSIYEEEFMVYLI